MNYANRLLSTALLSALAAAPAAAQDFDVQVQVDPRAGTATYDFHFNGPPRGSAVLWGGYGLLANPVQLPGMGLLYLDPALSLSLMTVPLDQNGYANFKLPVNLGLVEGDCLCFQTLFVDTNRQLRLSHWGSTYYADSGNDQDLGVNLWHNARQQTFKGEFWGDPNATVEIITYRNGNPGERLPHDAGQERAHRRAVEVPAQARGQGHRADPLQGPDRAAVHVLPAAQVAVTGLAPARGSAPPTSPAARAAAPDGWRRASRYGRHAPAASAPAC